MYQNYPGDNGFQPDVPKRSPLSRFFKDPEFRYNRLLFFTGNVIGLGVLGYLVVSFMFSTVLRGVGFIGDLYESDVEFRYLLEILYSFFCVGLPFLAVFIILKNTRVYKPFNIPLGRAYASSDVFLLIIAGLGICFTGNILTNYLAVYADSAGFGFNSYYEALRDTDIPDGVAGTVVLILHSALVPAMVEEFAFRGVVMQSLRRYGDVFAIICSAVLFGLIHGNMTQMPFAVIAGLALGYCATVTGTLRTSMIIHFLNNFVSVMVSVVVKRFGEGPGTVFSSATVYGFIVIGVIALAIYALRNPRFLRLRPGKFGFIRKKGRSFFLAPVLVIAVLWICWYILLDVSPIYNFFTAAR